MFSTRREAGAGARTTFGYSFVSMTSPRVVQCAFASIASAVPAQYTRAVSSCQCVAS